MIASRSILPVQSETWLRIPSNPASQNNANYVHVKEKASIGLELMLPQLIIKSDMFKKEFKDNKEKLKV